MIQLLSILIVSFFGIIQTYALESPTMCTAQYEPVCGWVQVQCIQAPCPAVRTDFGNSCMAAAAGATDVTGGTCIMSESTPPVVGGDIDSHGCKASAGYSWDPMMSACVRPWEKPNTLVKWAYGSGLTQYKTLDTFGYDRSLTREESAALIARAAEKIWGLRYASYPDHCNIPYADEATFDRSLQDDIYLACALDLMHGQDQRFSATRTLSRAEALAIIMRAVDGGKQDETGPLWYGFYADRAHELDILSFANFSGFDEEITRGELIEWIYKATIYMNNKKTTSIENPLIGSWTLIFHNSTPITSTGYTLSFEQAKVSGKFCNNMFGSYTLVGNTISSPGLASTMMYCEGQAMTLENAFTLDGATYSLQALRLMAGATGPTMHLMITTKGGDIFTYGM